MKTPETTKHAAASHQKSLFFFFFLQNKVAVSTWSAALQHFKPSCLLKALELKGYN